LPRMDFLMDSLSNWVVGMGIPPFYMLIQMMNNSLYHIAAS